MAIIAVPLSDEKQVIFPYYASGYIDHRDLIWVDGLRSYLKFNR